MPQKVEISSKTIIFAVFFVIALQLIWLVRELIFALFLAFICMSALKPAVNFFVRSRIPRPLSALLVFLSALIIFSIMVSVIIPPFIQETLLFIKSLPTLIQQTTPQLSNFVDVSSFTSFLPDITQNFFKVISSIFSNLVFIVSVLFFTFYFLLEEHFLKNFLDKFIDEKKTGDIVAIVSKVERRMGAWVWGEVILMTVIGVMTYIGLTILQVKYILPLAVLAGLLEVVPILGPTLSAIPAFFVALSSSWALGIMTVGLYIVIQQLENNLVVPYVMKKAVGLNPIMTLIALSVGGKLGGLLGILLSVPIALLIETLMVEFAQLKK